VIVYKCVVCGKSFVKRESLAAHLGHHREVEFARLSVRVPKDRLEWFKAYCKRHNTTTCHLILTFFDMLEAGEKQGHMVVGSPNPTVFMLKQYFAGAPRGRRKWQGLDRVSLEGTCSLCGKAATWVCGEPSSPWHVYLCDRHAYIRYDFPQYMRL